MDRLVRRIIYQEIGVSDSEWIHNSVEIRTPDSSGENIEPVEAPRQAIWLLVSLQCTAFASHSK